jgi:high affinity sulfate transporter 1
MTTDQKDRAKPRPTPLGRFLPILGWLRSYDRAWLTADVLAGLTLWGLVVPEGMAYAGIAGLPPQAGLYTLLASLLVYALFGSSRHLSVGATSATAALIAGTVVALGASTSDMATYQAYAVALVLVVGVVFLVAGLARLGFITQFLSKPVMDGFVFGLAFFVGVGQLNKLFGVSKGEGNVLEKLLHIIKQLPDANWVTFAVGASALALLFLLPRWNKKIPAGLVVLFGYIALSSVLKLNANYGVAVAGELPQGLPAISLPKVPVATIMAMVLPAIGIFLLAYSEALGVAREFAEKHGYEVDADQELNAHAFANLASSLFGGMIAAGGMSASAVKEGAGARTQVANLVAWGVTVVTLLFLTPLFTNLPEAVLAALIIHAIWHIIAARKLRQIRLVSRTEFWFALIAFLGVILIDVLQGMVIGLLCSIIYVVYKSSRPHLASLGRVSGVPGAYTDLARHPENTAVPGVLILRLDAPMYYANALTVRDKAKAMMEESETPLRAVILDASVQDELDITSAEVLEGLVKELQGQGIAVYVAELHAPVREFGRRTGLLDLIGEENVFPTVDLAVRSIETSNREGADHEG